MQSIAALLLGTCLLAAPAASQGSDLATFEARRRALRERYVAASRAGDVAGQRAIARQLEALEYDAPGRSTDAAGGGPVAGGLASGEETQRAGDPAEEPRHPGLGADAADRLPPRLSTPALLRVERVGGRTILVLDQRLGRAEAVGVLWGRGFDPGHYVFDAAPDDPWRGADGRVERFVFQPEATPSRTDEIVGRMTPAARRLYVRHLVEGDETRIAPERPPFPAYVSRSLQDAILARAGQLRPGQVGVTTHPGTAPFGRILVRTRRTAGLTEIEIWRYLPEDPTTYERRGYAGPHLHAHAAREMNAFVRDRVERPPHVSIARARQEFREAADHRLRMQLVHLIGLGGVRGIRLAP